MRVTITGATGLIGKKLVHALTARGDEVTVLSRDPAQAARDLRVSAERWDPVAEPAPREALDGRDGVIHLAGAPVAQRWTSSVKRDIRESRTLGTRNLVAGLAAASPTPPVLVSASAVGYYGPRGDERLDEGSAPGTDFLAQVCVEWEHEAQAATQHDIRVATLRTGIVLDAGGGALGRMLTPFRLGVGGPVAGGHQYMPWIHADDVVSLYLSALDDPDISGALNVAAPEPVTNRQFSKALGRALQRPAIAPVPAIALRVLYGEMAEIITEGQRAIPARALQLGHDFRHPDLDEALNAALS